MDGTGLSRSVVGSLAILSITALTARALADGIEGPALTAWYPKYNESLGLATHGPGCLNRPEQMPAGRESVCGKPELSSLGTGRYEISGENLAPFPTIAQDSGYLVLVTTVGSSAHCFEESTTASGTTLTSVVHCVSPETGDDLDTDFSWSYRADSLEHPQEGLYAPNFAYARVRADATLVPDESMNPLDLHADDILVAKNTGDGDYTVTFKDMNPIDGSLDPVLSPYNVLVQKTCIDDGAGGADPGGCFRAVCVPYAWTEGNFTNYDTSVHVRCFAEDGAPRDTGFRIFFGDEGFTSQGSFSGGFRYAWVDWNVASSATGCHTQPEIMGNSQHETPASVYPGHPVEVCRSSVGTYQVNFFEDVVAPYSVDGIAPVVSSRANDGTYCNVLSIQCPASHGVCGAPDSPPTTRVTLGCFDPAGDPNDAEWTMNATY